MPEWYKERIKQMQPQFNAIAQNDYGKVINRGPAGINSRPALIGAKYAESQGAGEAYHEAMLRAYWQEGRNIEDREEMVAIAESVGLEREAYLAAVDDPQWEETMLADVQLAHDYMITGVPALLFEQKYFLSGAQPYPNLVNILEQVREKVGK